jgi:hypothetical protein
MRLSGLLLLAVLLNSSKVWAQHPSGGGSSGGAASSNAGSHGGGGGSSYSGGSSGGHSYSGGSAGHSNSGSSGTHGWNGSSSHGSGVGGTSARGTILFSRSHPEAAFNSNLRHSPRELNLAPQLRPAPPERRSFGTFLRHPFRKPEPKTKAVANIVRPFCFRGHCPVCPGGQMRGGGCAAPVIPTSQRNGCSYQNLWNGNTCLGQIYFANDCGGLRMALEQQLERMRQAESMMQGDCEGAGQECSESTAGWNSQTSLYRALQSRYRSCLAQSASVFPFGGYMIRGFGSDLFFEPLSFELDY